jgi:hypothetical protein
VITVKLKYNTDDNSLSMIKAYMEHYSKCVRFMYNRICDNPSISEKDLRELSHNINNIGLLNAYQIQCCIKEAKQLYSTNGSGIVFGGRKNFIRRCKCRITKDEWNQKKLSSFCVLGEAPQKGNRNFRIDTTNSRIIFQPNKNLHINLSYSDKLHGEYAKIINSAEILQNNKLAPITYKIDLEYVYISLDEKMCMEVSKFDIIQNRVFAVDLNPNYIGWSVTEWQDNSVYKLIDSGTVSIKDINDLDTDLKSRKLAPDHPDKLYISNKRDHEVFEISKYLVNKAAHYKCRVFTVEDLCMKSSDHERGKWYNRLVNNQWNRDKLCNNISKRCNLMSIKFLKVIPNYSSFIGNVLYRSERLPDMVLASIEIGRRGYEFNEQYIEKHKPIQKNIVQPMLTERLDNILRQSLEELSYDGPVSSLVDLYYQAKKSGLKYRFPFGDNQKFSRLFSSKSLMFLIT